MPMQVSPSTVWVPKGPRDRGRRNSPLKWHESDTCRGPERASAPDRHRPAPPCSASFNALQESQSLNSTTVMGRREVRKDVSHSGSYFPSALNYTYSKIKTTSSTRDLLCTIYYAVVFHNLQVQHWSFSMFVVWRNIYPNTLKIILELFLKKSDISDLDFWLMRSYHTSKNIHFKSIVKIANVVLK